MDRLQLRSWMTPGFPASLFESLGAVIDADVTFETASSGPVPPDDPFLGGECDLGWVCSTSYVGLRDREGTPSIDLAGIAWVPDDADAAGRPVYFGDIIVREDSDIGTFEDLRGRSIGLNDPVSLSGNYALKFELVRRNEDPATFADLRFTGGHNISIDGVLDGSLDAACVDSVVRTNRVSAGIAAPGLRLVGRLGPWPTQPLVVRAGFDRERAQSIRDQLLAAQDRPEIAQELHNAGLAALVAVGPDHYEPVRLALQSAGT